MFDLRTMGFFSVITPFVLGVIMLIYLRERKVYIGFGYWVLANFAFSLGLLLVVLRGMIPDFLSVIVGNVIDLYGEILVYEGVQLFYGRSAFSLWNYCILGLYVLFQLYYTYLNPDINARIVLLSAVFLILILRVGFRLFQCSIPELRRTSNSAGYLFVFTAALPLFRGIHALLATQPMDLFSDVLSSWYSVGMIISTVAWTFYFFFLNTARLELELESARRELELIAMTDSLTNSYNRRHFDEHAETEFQRAKRFGKSLSFIMLDLDHFKVVNDTYGHEAGDRVLLSTSTTIESQVRSFDLVARYGGDEFIIMLVDTNDRQACSVAERIRQTVQQLPVVEAFGKINISLSIGVSTVEPNDTDLAMTLRRADTALYHAKNEGRNRVVFA